MNLDRFTKSILSVIAAALVVIAINRSGYVAPASADADAILYATKDGKIIAEALDGIAEALNRIANRL